MFMLYTAERRKYGILGRGKKTEKERRKQQDQSHKMVYTCNSELSGIFFMGLTKIATGNNG